MKFSDFINSADGRKKQRVPLPPSADFNERETFLEGMVAGMLARDGVPIEQVQDKVQTLRLQVQSVGPSATQSQPQPAPPPVQMTAELEPQPQPQLSISEQANNLRRKK